VTDALPDLRAIAAQQGSEGQVLRRLNERELEFGGLSFDIYTTAVGPEAPAPVSVVFGATMRVSGKIDGEWKELLRFDDFMERPHFHVPADAFETFFDRENGEPLEWYITQVRDHLDEWLTKAGFEEIVPTIDLAQVSANVDQLRDAMIDCVPEGFTRVPGFGLQRAES
jgi:hypothetical protein